MMPMVSRKPNPQPTIPFRRSITLHCSQERVCSSVAYQLTPKGVGLLGGSGDKLLIYEISICSEGACPG
jgi:hypothetical protein